MKITKKHNKYFAPHIDPLVPKIIGYDQKRVVVMRVEPNTPLSLFQPARKRQFDLARRISSYYP